MREKNYNCSVLCRMQANLFMNFKDYETCSPSVFIRRFMNSDVAKRFDNTEIVLERSSNASLTREIDEQYGPTTFGNPNKVDPEVLYWTGYVYRYWAFTREISSKSLYNVVKPEILFERYPIYHSFGLDYLIDRITEELHLVFIEKENKDLMELLKEFQQRYK